MIYWWYFNIFKKLLVSGFYGGIILLFPQHWGAEYVEASLRELENQKVVGPEPIAVQQPKQRLVATIQNWELKVCIHINDLQSILLPFGVVFFETFDKSWALNEQTVDMPSKQENCMKYHLGDRYDRGNSLHCVQDQSLEKRSTISDSRDFGHTVF